MKDILLTNGIGDVLAIESHWTPDERASLRTVYWASRARVLIPLFEASPTYRHVKHIEFATSKKYFTAENVRTEHPLPAHVEDWGVMRRFGELRDRVFQGSSFLREPPADVNRFNLPSRYVACQLATTFNGPCARAVRDLDDQEIDLLVERLDKEDVMGVVLNDSGDCPKSPRLISLVSQTSIAETVAVLRGACAFYAIASWQSCLASQIFSADRLWIKGAEDSQIAHRFTYHAPHQTFPFLHRHLSQPPWEPNPDLVQVRHNLVGITANQWHTPGAILEYTPDRARRLVADGAGEYYIPACQPQSNKQLQPSCLST